MTYEFSQDEIEKISEIYGLKLERKGEIQTWDGLLKFDKIYKGYRIIDGYKCKIIILPDYPNTIPLAHEIGNRTEEIAAKWNVTDLRNLHCNPGFYKSACLCVRQEEKIKFPPGSDFVYFIENLVIPYFYALSYFNEKGKWPWKEYSHGGLGLLEYHTSDKVLATREAIFDIILALRNENNNWKKYRNNLQKLRSNSKCICGSGNLFKQCHPDAFDGLSKLKVDIEKLGLNVYKLFQIAEKTLLKK